MPNDIFSDKSFRTKKVELRQDIMNSTESNPTLRKEIARVFQMANRRIQNIEHAGLMSPAVEALGKQGVDRYTKFSMKMDSWTALKMEYARAVAFLRQPTSTATGTREYNNYLKSTYGLTDQEFNYMIKYLQDKLTSMSDTDFVERYLMRYKDFTGEMETEAQSLSSMMESDAVSIERALQANVERAVDAVVDTIDWDKAFELEDEKRDLEDELNDLQ